MQVIASMGDLQIYAYTLVICVSTAFASTWPDFRPMNIKRTECPKNMACRWALCPWTTKPMLPSERTCLMVDNDVCNCSGGNTCVLSDIMDPGVSHIKYEYRCMAESDWPTLAHFFSLRKRSGIPRINDIMDSLKQQHKMSSQSKLRQY